MKLTPKQQSLIEAYGYTSPQSFLNVYPSRYEMLETKDIHLWQEGDNVVIHGVLQTAFKTQYLGGKRSLTRFSVLTDGELINVTLFNRPYLNASNYKNGITVIGTVDKYKGITAKTITNKPLNETLGIQVTYPLKSGFKNYEVSKTIQKILDNVTLTEEIPLEFKNRYKLLSKDRAVRIIHKPSSFDDLAQAARTLKYEEFLKYHLTLAKDNSHLQFGKSHAITDSVNQSLLERLPFDLTADQLSSLTAIVQDLASKHQMHRLLQGDVGSGKTVVAFLSAYEVIQAGYQVAFMVPTEILLQQHFANFTKLFPEVNAVSLSLTTENRMDIQDKIQNGEAQIVFGTHALFSDSTLYHNLGFVIIDEQHRFGVEQRRKLLVKGKEVDLLMLSATPIPRTLASALFFDLEVSTIQTYPASRKPIITNLIKENSLRSIKNALTKSLEQGEQIYVVCPAIENDDRAGVRSVSEIGATLQKVFSDYKVGILHGQLKPEVKEAMMKQFAEGTIDMLVATTVIEVGVDVHNANTIVIYNAEQFGLATLHQLRGRVGRGNAQGKCYILTNSTDEEALKRLQNLVDSNDGFYLSMQDMRQRGIGDALGTRQSGLPSFILGDIERDVNILKQAKIDAARILLDPNNPDYQAILRSLAPQDYIKII